MVKMTQKRYRALVNSALLSADALDILASDLQQSADRAAIIGDSGAGLLYQEAARVREEARILRSAVASLTEHFPQQAGVTDKEDK